MNKVLLIGGLLLSVAFVSCKKNYQCDCSMSSSVNFKERSRADAISSCKAKAKTSMGEECHIVN